MGEQEAARMRNDAELAADYARSASEEAFSEIVRRHGDMVYRCCLRVLGDAHAAEDAAQAVFLIPIQRPRMLKGIRNLAPGCMQWPGRRR